MIAYFDTSALVKLYVEEDGTDVVRAVAHGAAMVATSRVTRVEFHSAISRKIRLGEVDDAAPAVEDFERDWPAFIRVRVLDRVLESARRLSTARGLRAYDAIQLASALDLGAPGGSPIRFVCFDRALALAAVAEGLAALPVPAL